LGREIHSFTQEFPMLKMILATVVTGAFLISTPVRAEDKAPTSEKGKKGEKAEKKDEKAPKKDEKAGGGW
jgi:hypothetical protein